jgi:DNA invertase Pin-like site-specific DNA recombinase
MTFMVVAAMAAFEADILRERTKAGVAAARRRGKHVGRPAKKLDLDHARELRDAGRSIREIAAELNVGRSILHRALQAAVPEVPSNGASAAPCFTASSEA